MSTSRLFIIGGVLIALGAGIVQFSSPTPSSESQPETSSPAEEQDASVVSDPSPEAVEQIIPSKPMGHPLPLVKGDTVASWAFKGAYADNPELILKAESEIRRLEGLLGKGTFSDTTLYVGIANNYELLGDGARQYDYLGRAIRADEEVTTGLPWHNLGVLLARLGALETARIAYEKATIIQPGLKQWWYAYLEFLTTRMRSDTAAIDKAFSEATAILGQDPDILALRAEWEAL